MRLWSIHPKYLDKIGLVALWREALLAKKVLEGKTKGYKNHPQLERFKQSNNPIEFINKYLESIYKEAISRGYKFDPKKFTRFDSSKTRREKTKLYKKINITSGQLKYEIEHLLKKIERRAPYEIERIEKNIKTNPIFKTIKGKIESWEKIIPSYDGTSKHMYKKTLHIGDLDQIYKKLNLNVPQNAKRIIEIFEKNNSIILIPGGFVRDILLEKIPHDIDFATNISPDEIEKLLKKELSGEYKKIELQGKTFGVIRIIMNDNEIYEIATFRKDGVYSDGVHPDNIEVINSAKEDALRRDFTINALFYDPIGGDVIDYVGGLKDLQEKKLRFVGDARQRISEDKSRMLRYVRFLLYTNFSPDESDIEIMKKEAPSINNIPKELIKRELDKIINIANPKIILEILDKLNLLENIFPEIKSLEICEQSAPYHTEKSVLTHTKMVCKNLPENADSVLKWAAIFHDIGKPDTKNIKLKNNKEEISFIGHDKVGTLKTKTILKKLKFSKHDIEEISWLIENHIKIFVQLFDIIKNNKEQIAKEKCIKFLKKLINSYSRNRILNFITLIRADSLASISNPINGKRSIRYLNLIASYFEIANQELEYEKELGINISKIVDGKIIMKKLNIAPGKKLGVLKNQITNELSDQKFNSLEIAQNAFLDILDRLKN